MQSALNSPFDAVVLDIMLPGLDGLSVLRQIREKQRKTPILLLSPRGKVEERAEGLDLGADDYLPKPFALIELLARVRALLRRGSENLPPVLTVADLTLDRATRQVRRGQRSIELTGREYRLLEFLMRTAGRVSGRMIRTSRVISVAPPVR